MASAAMSAPVIVSVAIFADVTASSRMLPVATASEPLAEERSTLAIVPSRISAVVTAPVAISIRSDGVGRDLRVFNGVVGELGATHCAVRDLGRRDGIGSDLGRGHSVVADVVGRNGLRAARGREVDARDRAVENFCRGDRARCDLRGGDGVSAIFADVTASSRMLPVATASEPLIEDRSPLPIVPSRISAVVDRAGRDLGRSDGVRRDLERADRVRCELGVSDRAGGDLRGGDGVCRRSWRTSRRRRGCCPSRPLPSR